MIKFFRNIRRNLLSENRFTRYLLYAIGEIILVVIGILIAVNINNWNEERKNKTAREALLMELGKGTKWKLSQFAEQIYLRDSIVQLYISDDTPEVIYNNPQVLYALFDPRQGFMQNLGSMMNDENVDLILDKKKEYPEEFELMLTQLKLYKSSLDNYSLSYQEAKMQLDEIEEYLKEKNLAMFKFDSTDFANMKRLFLHDETFKTKLRAYNIKYRNFVGGFSGMRSTYTIVLAEIDELLGQDKPKDIFKREGFERMNAISCDSVSPIIRNKSAIIKYPLVPVIPVRNAKKDSIFIGALNPAGIVMNKTPIPGGNTLSFNFPEETKFKIFDKNGECLFNGISKRNRFVVIE